MNILTGSHRPGLGKTDRAKFGEFVFSFFLALILVAAFPNRSAAAAVSSPVRVTLGKAVVALGGPWKFHVGDDPRWAQPNFDDSSWETVDLTPPSRSTHDPDVGLTGYVPGWQARGHRGYFGFAWYRIHVSADALPGEPLALCAPYYVDGAYQVFVNGRFLGGTGDFSSHPPVVYNIHLPKFFPLPEPLASAASANQSFVIAVRVWTDPIFLGSPDSGGIHIAPALGTLPGVKLLYQRERAEMIAGYIVDAGEAVFFLVLAVMACTLIPFDPSDQAYLWMAGALVVLACARGNQAVYFWWQFESLHGFELFSILLFVPLSLAAWTLAWCRWFRLRGWRWMRAVIAVLTVLYICSESLLLASANDVLPRWLGSTGSYCATLARFGFIALTLSIIFRVLAQRGGQKWFGLPAILLMSVGLYTTELVKLHIPGIWFPFGVGVSLSQYSYAAFDITLFWLFVYRLRLFARGTREAAETGSARLKLERARV